jgi:hypothetical protein
MLDRLASTLAGVSIIQSFFNLILKRESSGICEEGKSSPHAVELTKNMIKIIKI